MIQQEGRIYLSVIGVTHPPAFIGSLSQVRKLNPEIARALKWA